MTSRARSTARLFVLGAVVATALASVGYYLYLLRTGISQEHEGTHAVVDAGRNRAIAALRRHPHVAFRDMQPGPEYGRLAFASLDDRGSRLRSALSCNRIHFSARAGICLAVATHPAGYRAYLVDSSLDVTHTMEIPGTPSRARLSSNSELAAYTVFVGVDSYLAPGLSTRTRVLDVVSGNELADLEAFDVRRDGQTMRAVDFNFWGVTFTHDPTRFYATLGTAGRTFLVEGDLHARTLTVVADDVECPSLSPDGTLIAFKKRFGSGLRARWQPALLVLATRRVQLLPEPRHIDDQIEWLDDGHLLYAVAHSVSAAQRRSDVWVLATDGASAPSLFLADAESPAVVRP